MLSFKTQIKDFLQNEKPCIPLHFNDSLISKHIDELKVNIKINK